MSLAYTIQPPSGLGLSVGKSSFLANTLRKKASVSPSREYLRKVAQQQPGVPAGATPAAGPDIFDRFRDIWNFIRHGLTLLWYKGRARTGALDADQWKSFQEAAQGLATNRTFKDVHGWWHGEKAKDAWNKYEYMPTAVKNLQHLHAIRTSKDPGEYYNNLKRTNPDITINSMGQSLDYFKKYHGLDDETYTESKGKLGLLPSVGAASKVGAPFKVAAQVYSTPPYKK